MATAGTASEAAHLLATRSKEELARGMASLAHKMHGFIESKKAPLLQLAHTASGLGGGVVSGVIRTFLPELWGIPVDGTLGVITSLFCLAGAGDNLVDAVAEFGVGLAAPAFSRGTEGILRTWLAAPKTASASTTAKAA